MVSTSFATRAEALRNRPAPLGPAPFKKGQRVEYRGDRKQWTERDGKRIDTMYRGMVVTITGTGEQWMDLCFDEEEQDWYWSNHSGSSKYTAPGGMRCQLNSDTSDDWTAVE